MIKIRVQEIPSKIIERNIKYNQIRRKVMKTKFQWLSKYVSGQIKHSIFDNSPPKVYRNNKNKHHVYSTTESYEEPRRPRRQSVQTNNNEGLYHGLKRNRLITQPSRPTISHNMQNSSLLLQNINPDRSFTFVEGNSRNLLGLKNRTNLIVMRKQSKQNSKLLKMDDRLSPWNYQSDSIDNKQNLHIF